MNLVEKIRQATQRIDGRYFDLPVAGREPIKRERAYCYELYHQLRLIFGDMRLTLTAEPDKRGHPDFDSHTGPNPDLILHLPGVHRYNAAVIEVECRPDLGHLKKDLKTLKLMQGIGYRRLILLLFGVDSVPWKKLIDATAAADLPLAEIVVLLHRTSGEEARLELPPNLA
ncbi:methionyl-tRNA formyltransferase-like protein [Luteimonas gilva]|uniref:Methionyl-tRNA formyltransferase-like protein n=1 Tax=Luteimonas gilva TaxID=2572684 RepID=A0A4U5JZE8_9GAMM|nr:methionyl-tRNA formyltransferase-like protein [Luteimonas gilva]TKR34131.1 methionyl-tRNA formyltransferase-like protein [Luteimonas gilva]